MKEHDTVLRQRGSSFALKHVSKNCYRTIVLCFIVVCLGSSVRSHDAGLSCPDWPLCYGRLVPFFDLQIFLEWFHRVLAALLSINLIYLAFIVLRNKELRRSFEMPLYAAFGLLSVQIILGGLTVLQLVDPGIVSLHLFNAILFLGILLWIYAKAELLACGFQNNREGSRLLFVLAIFMIFLLLVQIFLGGLVSTNFAGTVCPDFPTCFGSWWPQGGYLVHLQMGHRYLGIFIGLVAISFSLFASKSKNGLYTRRAARYLPTLVVLQIGLGAVNVIYTLPKWSSLLHLANAVIMFMLITLALVELAYQTFTLKSKKAIKELSVQPVLELK